MKSWWRSSECFLQILIENRINLKQRLYGNVFSPNNDNNATKLVVPTVLLLRRLRCKKGNLQAQKFGLKGLKSVFFNLDSIFLLFMSPIGTMSFETGPVLMSGCSVQQWDTLQCNHVRHLCTVSVRPLKELLLPLTGSSCSHKCLKTLWTDPYRDRPVCFAETALKSISPGPIQKNSNFSMCRGSMFSRLSGWVKDIIWPN